MAIVPTTDLQGQWYGEISRHLIHGAGLRATLGMLGDGRHGSLGIFDILVATVAERPQVSAQPTRDWCS